MKDLKQELEALLVSLNELKEAMNSSLNLLSSRIEDVLKESEEQKPTIRRIPFDIEKAKQGAKVITRDGRDTRILCFDCKSKTDPIVAAAMGPDDVEEEIISYTKDGKYYLDGDDSCYDLFIQEVCV